MVYARTKPTQTECWRRTLLWSSPEAAMSTREGTQGRRVTSRFICSTNELPRFEKPPPALKLPLLRSISLPSWLAYETRFRFNTAVGWRDQSTHEWWGSPGRLAGADRCGVTVGSDHPTAGRDMDRRNNVCIFQMISKQAHG